jgi:hypothetical protein
MKSSTLLSFLGIATTICGIAIGCGDDDKAATGAASASGESCTRTADCASGLTCMENVCGKGGGALSDGGAPPVSHRDGGGGGATSTPVALGTKGESCTRRADCEAGLSCILQTCTAGATAPTGTDGGAVPPVSALGTRGESCQSVRDCAENLTCVPRQFFGSGVGGGVCDLDEYGLEPTGKVCGAECAKPDDCCELPPGTTITQDPLDPPVAVSSCKDIVEVLLDGDASICNTTPPPTKDPACFYYKAYCDCAASTWSCTDNKCVYAAKCDHDKNVFKGCPTQTRTGGPTASPLCDTTANRCQLSASGCTTDASCETLGVFDDATDTCQKGECTCLEKKCYRKCDEDLDCAQRYTCDTTKKVCAPAGACSQNSECATTLRDVRAECQAGTCVLPCANDHECSGSGLASGGGAFNSSVCSKKGICEVLGCASDDECAAASGVRTFCTTPAAKTALGFRSAVTD